jgi:drug/metabolite transporter (DMT)-like permease
MTSSRSSRAIGTIPTLGWVMLVGVVLAVPLAAAGGMPDDLGAATVAWLVLAGTTNVVGLVFMYAAFRRGHVGVVAAVVSTEGAIAAVIAVAAGERPGLVPMGALAVVAAGVALVAMGPAPDRGEDGSRLTAALLALSAAGLFGFTLFASGQASGEVPAVWVALPARVVGVVLLMAALPFGVRIGRPGRRVLWAAVTGVGEVLGLVWFAIGARESTAVTAVVASQFSALAALAAYLFYGERLVRRQVAGLAAVAAGVAVIAGTA